VSVILGKMFLHYCCCFCRREASLQEAVTALGCDHWYTDYSRQYPIVAAAAIAAGSDDMKHHLQQLPWKQALPVTASSEVKSAVATAGAGEDGAGTEVPSRSRSCRSDTTSTLIHSLAEPEEGSITTGGKLSSTFSVSSGGRVCQQEGEVWWEVEDVLCDFCFEPCCDRVACQVCEVAQYCSSKCQKAAEVSGAHAWKACSALAAVGRGRLEQA
jgi:hypothetical protein